MDEKHNQDHECECGCGHNHDDEMVEYDTVNITFEDDTESECAVLDLFELNGQEYIVLLPLEDNEEELVYIYRYNEGENDEFSLDIIEDEDELNAVCDMFEERADADMDEE
ncbi:MAG: DUF1292 domain-containing protein [Ezakiella sp.]|nr:DUF1292 domain-containing protein [Ezakiella sp.]MDD7471918.1 DUF1292 domain-containing protein [Bacillota bacterium]MDY3923882.1 DUF1292 domain-containing protein [Ezakiella sp.]